MRRSRLIIGVMGGGEQKLPAQRLGAAITIAGHIVLTGGLNQDSREAKDAALFGAAEAAKQCSSVARLVGILKHGSPDFRPRISPACRSLILYTGLESAERDCITGTTPDGLIVLRGSCGTLTEAAFAQAAGRPILLLSARDWLTEKAREHARKKFLIGGGDGKLGEYFTQASAIYSKSTGISFSEAQLEAALEVCLATSEEFPEGQEAEAVRRVVARVARGDGQEESAFPGLPYDPSETRRLFNEAICELEH